MTEKKVSRREALAHVSAVVAGTVGGSTLASGKAPAAPGADNSADS